MKNILSITVLTFLLMSGSFPARTQEIAIRNNRHILENAYSKIDKSVINPGGEWFPYPKYTDRVAWDNLFGNYKSFVIKSAEKYLKYEWKLSTATDYLALERNGDRMIQENKEIANKKALTRLVLGELAEGKGRFIDQIVNCLWMESEKSSWVCSNHQRRQHSGRALPDPRDVLVDLVSQQWGLIISVTYHFFSEEFEKIDPVINYCVEQAMERNIFTPYLDDSKLGEHKWLGLNLGDKGKVNNWNPWSNSNILLAFLLMEKDREKLLSGIGRIVRSADVYLDTNPLDGGCDEGAAYWGHAPASMYDLIRIMNDATNGTFGCFDDPQIRQMAFYKSRTYMGDGWVANFGDGVPRAQSLYALAYRYGKDCGLNELVDYALYVNSIENGKDFGNIEPYLNDIYRTLESLRYGDQFRSDAREILSRADGDMEVLRHMLRSDVPRFTWYETTQHCFFNNGNGWFFATKASHNNEMHNHNDVGTCILVVDDIPVLVDAGQIKYTRDTFGPNRYSVWNTQSQWHNLPSINGIQQHCGAEYYGSDVVTNKKNSFSLDISHAYPQEALCKKWVRSYSLGKTSLEIKDSFELEKRNAPDVINFITRGDIHLPGEKFGSATVREGQLIIETWSFDKKRKIAVELDYPSSLKPSIAEAHPSDNKIKQNWGGNVSRITLISDGDAPVTGEYEYKLKLK